MKHCKSCDNCEKDLLCEYFKGIDLYRCTLDNHPICDPFWDKCDEYTRNFMIVEGSMLFNLVRKIREVNAQKQYARHDNSRAVSDS